MSASSARRGRAAARGALRADRPRLAPRSGPVGLRRCAAGGDAARGARSTRSRRSTSSRPAAGGARARSPSTSARPAFALVRALAIEAYYSDFVAPGREAPGAWAEIDFNSPLARAARQGLVLPGDRMRESFDVIVVGSGGGRRRRRRRARAARPRRAPARSRAAPDRERLHALGGEGGTRPLLAAPASRSPPDGAAGRVPRRPLRRRHDDDQHQGRPARARAGRREVACRHRARRTTRASRSPSPSSSAYYDRVERCLGVRERQRLVQERLHGRAAASARSGPSSSRCTPTPTRTACGAAPASRAARPTPASRRMNTYIHDALGARPARAARERARRARARRGPRRAVATGVEYIDEAGDRVSSARGAVVVAARRRSTRRSCSRARACGRRRRPPPRPASRCGSSTGSSTSSRTPTWSIRSRAHCMAHQHDEDGGFVIEATTIQDPISFATTLTDERGPAVGPAARRGGRGVPPLDGRARDGRTTRTPRRRRRRGRERALRRRLQRRRAAAPRRALRASAATCSRRPARSRSAGRASPRRTSRAACRMGDDPAALGRRPQRASPRGQAALRRRRLARSADAVGQPVADDHGARDAARRPPRRRSREGSAFSARTTVRSSSSSGPSRSRPERATSSCASAAPASARPTCTRSRA